MDNLGLRNSYYFIVAVLLSWVCLAQQKQDFNIDSLVKTDFKPWSLKNPKEIDRLSRAFIKYGRKNVDSQALAVGLYGMGFSENKDTIIKFLKELVQVTENKRIPTSA